MTDQGSAAKPRRSLTDVELIRARELWQRGETLGDIAKALGVSLYALTPWITSWEACDGR